MTISKITNKTRLVSATIAAACLTLSPIVALGQTAAVHADTIYSPIAVRSVASANTPNSGASSLAISKPAGATSGDVLVAQIAVAGASSTTITAPTGWSQIRRDNSGSSIADALYYHVVAGTDGANYTWSFNASKLASGGIGAFSGVDTSSPIDASSGLYNSTGSTAMSAPSVTTTTPADELLFFGGLTTRGTVTAPAGMSSRWTTATKDNTSFMANKLLTAQGATGNQVGTASTQGYSNISQLVALKPQATVTTPPPTQTNATFVQADALSPGNKMTTETSTFSKAVQQGDLLVGWFAQYDATGQVTVSDNVNGAWTRGPSETFANGGGDIALYYKINSAAAPTGLNITISASGSTYLPYAVANYTGVGANVSLDQTAVAFLPASANSSVAVAGPTASVAAGDLIFGGQVTGGIPASFTVGNSQGVSFAKRATNFDSGSAGVEDILSGAAGGQSSSFTYSSATDWYSVVAAFKLN